MRQNHHFQYKCLNCGHVWVSKGIKARSVDPDNHFYIPPVCPNCRKYLRSVKGGTVEIIDLIHDIPAYIPLPRASRKEVIKYLGEEVLDRKQLSLRERLKLETKSINEISFKSKKRNIDEALIDYWAMH